MSELEASPLPFLHLMEILKHLPRTGWLRTIESPESVASHSFRLALLGLCAPNALDRMQCMFIGLCHDMAESVVGDIPTYAGVPKDRKHKLEYIGMQYISELLRPYSSKLAIDIMLAWQDYEEGGSAEARYMREMDKFECMMQAVEYEQKTHGTKDLDEFQGLSAKINSVQGTEWLKLLQKERRMRQLKRERRLYVIFVIGEKNATERQCNLLSKEFGYQHISLDNMIAEKSGDQSCRFAQLLRNCIAEDVEAPAGLMIDLLESQIEKDGDWTLISGFPRSLAHFIEFEEKVQKPNYTLLLRSSEDDSLHNGKDQGQGDLEAYLRLAEDYSKELKYSSHNDLQLCKAMVEGFRAHSQEMKQGFTYS